MGMFSSHLTPCRNLCSAFSTMWELLRDGLQLLRTISHSRAALAAEILFLRKQLAYYQDHRIRPRRLRDASRLCLLFWSRLFDWQAALVVVKTSTFIRWHRKGFRLYWRWKSRGGRPSLPKEIRQLIARMVRENVTWGAELSFVERNHEIQALSPYRSHQSFTVGIRLRCPDRRTQHSESEGALHFRVQLRRKDRIAIVNEELIGMIARNGVPQLLEGCGPQKVRSISRGDLLQPIFVVQSAEHLLNSYPTIRP